MDVFLSQKAKNLPEALGIRARTENRRLRSLISVCFPLSHQTSVYPALPLGCLGALWFYFPGDNSSWGVASWGNKGRRGGRWCPGQSLPAHCLPALLPHALFLEHSFEFPFPLLIVESIPGLSMARNRRKLAPLKAGSSVLLTPGEETERSSSLSRRLPAPEELAPLWCCASHRAHFNAAFKVRFSIISALRSPRSPLRHYPSATDDSQLPPPHLSAQRHAQ